MKRKRKKVVVKRSGKCQLKEMGMLSTTAGCDIPRDCRTCPWNIKEEKIERKKELLERWENYGY